MECTHVGQDEPELQDQHAEDQHQRAEVERLAHLTGHAQPASRGAGPATWTSCRPTRERVEFIKGEVLFSG